MVRRWSRVNSINFDFSNSLLFEKRHKVNVFKKSVNYKRFVIKFSKHKRKSLMRIKHRTNWLIYTNILKFWSRDYNFIKYYTKFQFLNNILVNNFFFYNFNFIKNKNENLLNNFNFIFFNWTKKSYNYFFKYNYMRYSYVKNSPISMAWFLTKPTIGYTVIPTYRNWDLNFYQATTATNVNVNSDINFNLDDLFTLIYNLTILKNLELYKIFIIFYHNSIFKL